MWGLMSRQSGLEKDHATGKTVHLQALVWHNPQTGDILLSLPTEGFITSVSNKEGSSRCHPHLYAKLKAVLQRRNRWPSE